MLLPDIREDILIEKRIAFLLAQLVRSKNMTLFAI